MSIKENILESWIMVEHLSEGNIKLRDSAIHTFNGIQNDDYYSFFSREINRKKGTKRGLSLFIEMFVGRLPEYIRNSLIKAALTA